MKKNYKFEMFNEEVELYSATYTRNSRQLAGFSFTAKDSLGQVFLTQDEHADDMLCDYINTKLAKFILGELYIEGRVTYIRSNSSALLSAVQEFGEPVRKVWAGVSLKDMTCRGSEPLIYNRMRGYHSTDRSNVNSFAGAQDKDLGGIELETEFPTDYDRIVFSLLFRSNFIFMEQDGSLNCGIEFITLPLPREFFSNPKFWEPLCKMVADCGGKSHDTSRCGLHEHVNNEALDDIGLVNLYELESTLERACEVTQVLTKIYRRSGGSYCQDIPQSCLNTIAQAKAINNIVPNAVSKKAMNEIRKKTKESLSADHCYKLNVRTSTGKTFEFRQGRGSLVAKSIAKIAEINELKVKAAAKGITTIKEFAGFCSKRSRLSNQLFEGINEI